MTATPTATPTSGPSGVVQEGDGIVWNDGNGKQLAVPAIPGLKAELEGGKVVYAAETGNSYKLGKGVYGSFKPDVTTQQGDGSEISTGGIILDPRVVSKLPAKTGETIVLPGDPSNETNVSVTFDTLGLHGWRDTPRVLISADPGGTFTILNTINDPNGEYLIVQATGVTSWMYFSDYSGGKSTIGPGQDNLFIHVYGDQPLLGVTNDQHSHWVFGGLVKTGITGNISVSIDALQYDHPIDLTTIRTIGGVPIFLEAPSTSS